MTKRRNKKTNNLFSFLVVFLVLLTLFVFSYSKAAFGETLIVQPLAKISYSDGFIANSIPRNGRAHLAQDYAASVGTAVKAIADGKVVKVFWSDSSGMNVIIEHNINGEKVWTRSCHHRKGKVTVSVGDTVTAGQKVAEVGDAGSSCHGAHLHFQIASGKMPDWGAIYLDGNWPRGEEVNGPITYKGTTYWSPKRVITGKDIIGDPTPVTTLTFSNIVYPKTYKISSSGWNLSGGSVATDKELKTLFVKIYRKSDNKIISQMATTRSISGKRFNINNLDGEGKDNGQKFSKITEAGEYIWSMTATDSEGREVHLEIPFTAVTNQSTATATISSTGSSTTHSETPLSGVYQFNKNDDCRSGPGESYSEVKKMSKGDIVFVVASTLSEYNYTWYKLSDGSYVYSGDVDKINLTETSMSGQYKFTRADESRTWPYEASTLVKSYSKGATITIKAKVVNTYNNTWYKISDGSYVWSGDVEPASGVQELQFSGVKYPTNYKIGSSNGYILSDGTLASNCELKTITTTIKNSSGTAVSGPKTRNISGYSYSIKNLDTMESGDNGVKFSKINSAGQYTWVLTATDSGNNTLTMEMPFTASSSATSSGTMSKRLSDVNKPVTSVTITLGENSGSNISATYYGYNEDANLALFAQVSPTNATNPMIKWTSSNEKVLKLSNSENMGEGGTLGSFTKTGVGSTVITATAQDGSGIKATLTYNYYISSISLEALDSQIYVDQTTSVIPAIVPSIAAYQDITWESSSPWVASVDEYGYVTGIGAGTTVITATAKDGGAKKGTCTITVLPVSVENIYLDVSQLSLSYGTSYTLYYDISPYNATNWNVTWSSSNTSVATVDDGMVTAVGFGTAIICATTEDGNKTAECEISVISSGGSCGDNLTWSFNNGKLAISGNGAMYNYQYNYDVPWSGFSYLVTEVEIGENVSSIGDNAFNSCCYLPSITIPRSITSIGSYSFAWCGSLTNIYFDSDALLQTIGEGAFENCTNLYYIYIPEGVTKIDEYCFRNCTGLTQVSIPNTVTDIGSWAFLECDNLETAIINNDGTVIESGAFPYNGKIVLRGNIESCAHFCAYFSGYKFAPFSMSNPGFVLPSALKTIETEAFEAIDAYAVYIPDGVLSIESKAFMSCSNLREIRIPESVNEIQDDAFSDCRGWLIIYGKPNSTAETFANQHSFIFVDETYDFSIP